MLRRQGGIVTTSEGGQSSDGALPLYQSIGRALPLSGDRVADSKSPAFTVS